MSATQANTAEFQNAGKPVAPPVYQVDASGNVLTAPAAQQGYVAASSANAAALTGSTDYSFAWTSAVNHVMLQNNTGSNLNWDLDVAATAGSPLLATGQTVFLDVRTTILHLFAAGTPNVNGTSAANICVRGWL